jgi:hypothetical protein
MTMKTNGDSGLPTLRELHRDIREYVSKRNEGAIRFSTLHSPKYDHVPIRAIQRIIDEEIVASWEALT